MAWFCINLWRMPLRDLNTTFLKEVKTGVNPIMLKVATHTLKILRCKQTKIFKVCSAIFQHNAWTVVWTLFGPSISSTKKSVQNGWMINLSKYGLISCWWSAMVIWITFRVFRFVYFLLLREFQKYLKKKSNSLLRKLNPLNVVLRHHRQVFEIICFAVKFWQHKQIKRLKLVKRASEM